MKKLLSILLIMSISCSMVLMVGIDKVSAQGTVPPATGEENPTWVWDDPLVQATIIPVDKITTAPPAWQQLLSTGLDISGSATICYPFRGGQFGWVGQIRLLYNDTWIPISTKTVWTPNEEGKLMACAYARYAGVYALFGYWQEPTDK